MKYTLAFDDARACEVGLSGGKGANLSLLTLRGFPVPTGFIVTAHAYDEFSSAGADALPPGLAREVELRLRAFPRGETFAVRSSATCEDGAKAAFAGQHDTYLNCAGLEEVLDRIRGCYRSLWNERALAYRERMGVGAGASMAVVVQRMVRCEVAGVAFTVHPVTGNLGEMVVNACLGLGESVVQGEDVDEFVIDKARLRLDRCRLARKSSRLVAVAGGTRAEDVSDEEACAPCLDEAQIARLAGLLVAVERSFQFPQDLEWGIADGEIHLLQSRPVSVIPARWTRDESAERFPSVMTPLTWDFIDEGFHRSLRASFQRMGLPTCPGKWFDLHDHYVYGNQNVVDLYARRAPLPLGSFDELRAAMPAVAARSGWIRELPARWERDLDRYLLRIGELSAVPLEGKDLRGLWRHVREVEELGASYFEPNIAISITQATLCRALQGVLRLVVGEGDAPRYFDGLLACCDTPTGAVNREMYDLALAARERPDLARLLVERTSLDIVRERLLVTYPEFAARFHRFLEDHGHREMDLDPYHPTWLEVPWAVLDQVRLLLETPMTERPADRERGLRRSMLGMEREVIERTPEDLRFFVAELIDQARAYTRLDDLEHYETTRLTLPIRRGLRAMGESLRARGVVEDPMDIFFARAEALDRAVEEDTAERWSQVAEGIRGAKAGYLAAERRVPDWVYGEQAEEADNDGTLIGLAGSPGVVEGPVFVVRGAEDFTRFPHGAILVARTTHPAWMPLFYVASALITEGGGPLSHGAVTAREMRIPAVLSVRGAMSLLANGQRVRVDGGRGTVTPA